MTEADPQIERLTNLTFAFLDADRAGRRFLTNEWIRTQVKGYAGGSYDAATKLLKRDIATLIRAGVPIETVAADEGNRYRLQAEEYSLPEVNFTPEEARMLGLAGELGQSGELGTFTRSGWTKIAASGATRPLSSTPIFNTVNDLSRLSARQLDIVLTACREHRRISFSYRSDPVSEPAWRTMDPWGIVNHRDRLYLVGYDPERAAPRSFRVFRVTEIEDIGAAAHRHQGEDLQKLVESSLRNQRALVDALISVTEGHALELTERAENLGEGRWRFIDVDRDWLVRTAAGYAPEVVLLEPVELREEIRALLSQTGKV